VVVVEEEMMSRMVLFSDDGLCLEIQTQKGSNERLFILTRTHNIHIFRETLLSSHKTTLKRQINGQKQWKMREKLSLFWFLLQCLEDFVFGSCFRS